MMPGGGLGKAERRTVYTYICIGSPIVEKSDINS